MHPSFSWRPLGSAPAIRTKDLIGGLQVTDGCLWSIVSGRDWRVKRAKAAVASMFGQSICNFFFSFFPFPLSSQFPCAFTSSQSKQLLSQLDFGHFRKSHVKVNQTKWCRGNSKWQTAPRHFQGEIEMDVAGRMRLWQWQAVTNSCWNQPALNLFDNRQKKEENERWWLLVEKRRQCLTIKWYKSSSGLSIKKKLKNSLCLNKI